MAYPSPMSTRHLQCDHQNNAGGRYTPISPDRCWSFLIAGHSVGADFIALPDGTAVTDRSIPGSLVTLSSVAGQARMMRQILIDGAGKTAAASTSSWILIGQYLITFTPPPGYTAIPSFFVMVPQGRAVPTSAV